MSAINKIKEIIENNKNSAVSPIDLINPNTPRSTEQKAKDRYSICQSCPELTQTTFQCKKCGCFMKIKVTLEQATCPLNKW